MEQHENLCQIAAEVNAQIVDFGTASFAFRSITHHFKPTQRQHKMYIGVKLVFLPLLG